MELEDERDERAWVAFAAGFRQKGGYSTPYTTVNENTTAAAAFADNMMYELIKRRKKYVHEGGPYRASGATDVMEWDE